jgi:hypothetical protein
MKMRPAEKRAIVKTEMFEPDIIVTNEGSEIALVAEVKTSLPDLRRSELQLKQFMAAMRCPVGLLITPENLRLYRDRYLPSPEDSIEVVGTFDVKNVLHFEGTGTKGADGVAFERLVQSWLEGLVTGSGLRELSTELRGAVQAHIVPAILQGSIRAGHPRSVLTA